MLLGTTREMLFTVALLKYNEIVMKIASVVFLSLLVAPHLLQAGESIQLGVGGANVSSPIKICLVLSKALTIANPDYQQPKPDCISTEPGPGNACYCFYNGQIFKCLKKEGRPGNNCSYHSDCQWSSPVVVSIPTLGLLVPSWHHLTL